MILFIICLSVFIIAMLGLFLHDSIEQQRRMHKELKEQHKLIVRLLEAEGKAEEAEVYPSDKIPKGYEGLNICPNCGSPHVKTSEVWCSYLFEYECGTTYEHRRGIYPKLKCKKALAEGKE